LDLLVEDGAGGGATCREVDRAIKVYKLAFCRKALEQEFGAGIEVFDPGRAIGEAALWISGAEGAEDAGDVSGIGEGVAKEVVSGGSLGGEREGEEKDKEESHDVLKMPF
jgi:hypothetical protein